MRFRVIHSSGVVGLAALLARAVIGCGDGAAIIAEQKSPLGVGGAPPAGACEAAPPRVGWQNPAGGSVSATAGAGGDGHGELHCGGSLADAAGGTFEFSCTGSSCECRYRGLTQHGESCPLFEDCDTVCACELAAPITTCDTPSFSGCCPDPWPQLAAEEP